MMPNLGTAVKMKPPVRAIILLFKIATINLRRY